MLDHRPGRVPLPLPRTRPNLTSHPTGWGLARAYASHVSRDAAISIALAAPSAPLRSNNSPFLWPVQADRWCHLNMLPTRSQLMIDLSIYISFFPPDLISFFLFLSLFLLANAKNCCRNDWWIGVSRVLQNCSCENLSRTFTRLVKACKTSLLRPCHQWLKSDRDYAKTTQNYHRHNDKWNAVHHTRCWTATYISYINNTR